MQVSENADVFKKWLR